jgi:hypothetical protein
MNDDFTGTGGRAMHVLKLIFFHSSGKTVENHEKLVRIAGSSTETWSFILRDVSRIRRTSYVKGTLFTHTVFINTGHGNFQYYQLYQLLGLKTTCSKIPPRKLTEVLTVFVRPPLCISFRTQKILLKFLSFSQSLRKNSRITT